MCSVQGGDVDDLGDFQCREKIPNVCVDLKTSRTCKDCGEKSVFLLQRKDPVCRSCFQIYCNHKFRSAIGKSKKLKPSDKVLIAYSGDLCSAAMVGLTEQALSDSVYKKMKFIPAVLHINETFITGSTNPDFAESCPGLKEWKHPVLLSSLEMALRDSDDSVFYWEHSSSSKNSEQHGSEELKCILMKSLSNTKSLSAKLDYVKLLRTQLITDIAKHAGHNFVFCGDSSDDLAQEVICDIAMGRGSQISSDTSFYDTRYQIPICRPLRDLMKRELAYFNHINNIVCTVPESLITKTHTRMSIQRLTETFINGLQENFSSTIPTIFRTGGKVSSLSSNALQPEYCIMCMSELDNVNPGLCSALELLSVSSKLSQSKEINGLSCQDKEDCSRFSCSCESRSCLEENQSCSSHRREQNILSYLCHGCQTIFEEMGLNKNLQPELMSKLKKKINRMKIKEDIKEFLLED